MDVKTNEIRGIPLLELEGEIDHGNCGAVESAVATLLDGNAQALLLDLQRVNYIDSGGLSVILSTMRRLRGKGWLGVIGPNANVTRLLEIVGLLVDPDFRVFADRADAETLLAPPAGTSAGAS
jgi:anti-anti-sigma factor